MVGPWKGGFGPPATATAAAAAAAAGLPAISWLTNADETMFRLELPASMI